MSLTKPVEKIKSSFAMFEFSNRELVYLRDNLDWTKLEIPNPTGPTNKHYSLLVGATRIATLGYHCEILQESLNEYIQPITNSKVKLPKDYLDLINNIRYYLYYLRCALLHAKGELVPLWSISRSAHDSQTRIDTTLRLVTVGFKAEIPCKLESNGFRFDIKSKSKKTLKFVIKENKKIKINDEFINKLRLLSWHILTITQKKSIPALIKYFDIIVNKKEIV